MRVNIDSVLSRFGWISKNCSIPESGKRNCLHLNGESYTWGIGISAGAPEEILSSRNSPKQLEPLICHALKTQEFYALTDYLMEHFAEHPVTKLLTEIVMEGQKV